MDRKSWGLTAGVSFLVLGNLIGAGILALPINTGLAGLWPSLAGMAVLGGAMFWSAVILGREAVAARTANFNYPSLYQRYLGRAGKWVAILANMLILYGLLVAYLTGGAAIIGQLLNVPEAWRGLLMPGLFVVVTTLTLMNSRLFLRYNALIMVVMLAAFALILALAWRRVDPAHFAWKDWAYLPAAAPIIITAFHFHNVIPNVCGSLDWNFGRIWKVMLAGMLLGFLMNAAWIMAGLGVLPLDASANGLLTAFHANLPATVPMSRILDSRFFTLFGMIFALLAIITSYLANGLGLMGFVRDMLENHCRVRSRPANVAVTFGPPLAIGLLYPDIFLKALNVVGGVGIVVLFGILPAVIFIKKASAPAAKAAGWILLLLFTACLLCEVGHETGRLQLRPHMEYWNAEH